MPAELAEHRGDGRSGRELVGHPKRDGQSMADGSRLGKRTRVWPQRRSIQSVRGPCSENFRRVEGEAGRRALANYVTLDEQTVASHGRTREAPRDRTKSLLRTRTERWVKHPTTTKRGYGVNHNPLFSVVAGAGYAKTLFRSSSNPVPRLATLVRVVGDARRARAWLEIEHEVGAPRSGDRWRSRRREVLARG